MQEAGLECNIFPIRSKDYPTDIQRPSFSVLDKNKIKENYLLSIPHWRRSLGNCIKLLN